jgi:hypothetical protein
MQIMPYTVCSYNNNLEQVCFDILELWENGLKMHTADDTHGNRI